MKEAITICVFVATLAVTNFVSLKIGWTSCQIFHLRRMREFIKRNPMSEVIDGWLNAASEDSTWRDFFHKERR